MEKPILVEFKPAKQVSWAKLLFWCSVSVLGSIITLYNMIV